MRRRILLRIASALIKWAGGAVISMEILAPRRTTVQIDVREVIEAFVQGKIGPLDESARPMKGNHAHLN